MKNELIPKESEFFLYTAPKGRVKIEVFFEDETVWLTINKMADLFGTTKQTISYHLQNIYKENELIKGATVKEILTVQTEGKRQVRRSLEYYNLDAIIAVGYRVNSYEATQFRIWATQVLKEFIVKGFAIDDERLKQGKHFGKDYFDELLERIREIRASERRFYQKITDIYSQCSSDYDPKSPTTKGFFATVQNKLHFAITGHTASEIIKARADSKQRYMGLQTWKNAPNGKILKSDVTVAKNYLQEDEIKELDRIVSMYLDYAELLAKRHVLMKMKDWIDRLNGFLKFNEFELLNNLGKVTAEAAKKLAEKEYAKFRVRQDKDFESDFDITAKKYLNSKE